MHIAVPFSAGSQAIEDYDIQSDAPSYAHPWFVGHMQQLVYNSNYYFDMAKENSMENIEITARFVQVLAPYENFNLIRFY